MNTKVLTTRVFRINNRYQIKWNGWFEPHFFNYFDYQPWAAEFGFTIKKAEQLEIIHARLHKAKVEDFF